LSVIERHAKPEHGKRLEHETYLRTRLTSLDFDEPLSADADLVCQLLLWQAAAPPVFADRGPDIGWRTDVHAFGSPV
jgi:hypothetical protein